MQRRGAFGAVLVSWLLAVILPAAASALWWLWMSKETTARACATGSRISSLALPVFAALVLVTPIGIMLQAWRARTPSRYVLPAVVTGTFIAAFAVFMTGEFWWSGHNCMT